MDGLAASKVAVTVLAEFIVTVQPPRPLQAPDQPAKAEPAAGVALSVTAAPEANVPLQLEPQLMAEGDEETVPPPEPIVTVESAKLEGGGGVVDGPAPSSSETPGKASKKKS